MIKSRSRKIKYAIYSSLYVALVCITIDWVSFSPRWLQWDPDIGVGREDAVRILLVADVHLLGYQHTHSHIIRWDLDRYLSKTVNSAINHYEPHAIIYIGDLIDELYKATSSQITLSHERWRRIFPNSTPSIYVSGDNDVGGEGIDTISEDTVGNFNHLFPSPLITTIKFVRILKLDFYKIESDQLHKLMHEMEVSKQDGGDYINIAASHTSIMVNTHRSYIYPEKILKMLNCSLVLCAHEHKSEHTVYNASVPRITHRVVSSDVIRRGETVRVTASRHVLHEVMVPPATYRQRGYAPPVGYGCLTIESTGRMHYTVLWLPHRAAVLITTAVAATLTFLLYTSHFIYSHK